LAVLSAGALLAEQPFGRFGGTATGDNGGTGLIGLQGWALDDDGVAAVDIYVDGLIAGRADYGKPRTGVAEDFPGYPDAEAAGFAFPLETTHYLNGVHTVTARVLSATGERRFLAESYEILFTNTDHTMLPFGKISFPNRNVEMFGNCDLSGPRRYNVVYGWALDAGKSEGDMGVGYVELLLDGAILYNDQISCFYAVETGGLTNCYGLRSLAIEEAYPTLKNSPQAGFRFVLDIGALLNSGWTPGHHILTIRVGDIFTQVRNIDEIPVSFSCDDFTGNEGAFGRINTPRNGNMYAGTIDVVGWALDFEGVASVTVYIDGQAWAFAHTRESRPEVSLYYPGFPESLAPGWSYQLDTTELSDGSHHLQIKTTDFEGVTTLIGERTFRVSNDLTD
jgi:N-acetylmuramoyl-L-alanine amidase